MVVVSHVSRFVLLVRKGRLMFDGFSFIGVDFAHCRKVWLSGGGEGVRVAFQISQRRFSGNWE